MLKLQDRTILLDLTVAGELLAEVEGLAADDARLVHKLLAEEQLDDGQMKKLVNLLSMAAPADECSHGARLSQDFTLPEPVRIRNIVVASRDAAVSCKSGDLLVRLGLGLAFGSGIFPATQLCMEALLDHVRVGDRVADVGTGSGILAILAARLGARAVTAVDVRKLSVRDAQRNVALNHVENLVTVVRGSLESLEGSYDCIVASLWDDNLVWAVLGGLARHLAPGGCLISYLSTMLVADADFRRALTRLGLNPERTYVRDHRVVICLRAGNGMGVEE